MLATAFAAAAARMDGRLVGLTDSRSTYFAAAAAAVVLSVHVDLGRTTGAASSSRVACTTLCL